MNFAQKLRILEIANFVFSILSWLVIVFIVFAHFASWEYSSLKIRAAVLLVFAASMVLDSAFNMRKKEYIESQKKEKKLDSPDSNSEFTEEVQKDTPKRSKTKKEIFLVIVYYMILAFVLVGYINSLMGWSNQIAFVTNAFSIVIVSVFVLIGPYNIIIAGKKIWKRVDQKGSDGESDE